MYKALCLTLISFQMTMNDSRLALERRFDDSVLTCREKKNRLIVTEVVLSALSANDHLVWISLLKINDNHI